MIDGSLTIGDDVNEDTITVNAEFTSDLIPDSDNNFNIGSASKKWQNGYFDVVNSNQRDIKFIYYNYDGTGKRFIRFSTTGVAQNENAQATSVIIAPKNGELLSVQIRTKSGGGNTDISFHKASNNQSLPISNWVATETQQVNIANGNTTYTVTFANSTFLNGEILGISVDPTSVTDDVNMTVVFFFDWNS